MASTPRILHLKDLDRAAYAQLLVRTEDDLEPYIEAVRPVVDDVARRGDAALVDCAARFDGADISADSICATAADFARAEARLEPELKETLKFAADAIRRFHEAQMPEDMWIKQMAPGVLAGERWTSIRRRCLLRAARQGRVSLRRADDDDSRRRRRGRGNRRADAADRRWRDRRRNALRLLPQRHHAGIQGRRGAGRRRGRIRHRNDPALRQDRWPRQPLVHGRQAPAGPGASIRVRRPARANRSSLPMPPPMSARSPSTPSTRPSTARIHRCIW